MPSSKQILAVAAYLTAVSAPIAAQASSDEQAIYARFFKAGKTTITKDEARQLFDALRKTKRRNGVEARSPSGPKPPIVAVAKKSAQPLDLPTFSRQLPLPNCAPQEDKVLFVRSDPLDNFHFLVDPQKVADAKGASVAYTDNRASGTQNVTVNGRVSYLLLGYQCDPGPGVDPERTFVTSAAVAPFISSNGTFDRPLKTTSTDALRFGSDFQFGLSTGDIPFIISSYFYASPFHQTDYLGRANVNGVTLAWEPVIPALLIDSAPVTPYFSFFTQFRAEAEFTDVSNVGLTKLAAGYHSWVGETARANLALFPITAAHNVPEWIAGRLSIIASENYFWDAARLRSAPYYSAVLQYKLGECKIDLTKAADLPCSIQGASSLSLEYDHGKDKDTLVMTDQFLAKLAYAF